jgi:hypothetical protein
MDDRSRACPLHARWGSEPGRTAVTPGQARPRPIWKEAGRPRGFLETAGSFAAGRPISMSGQVSSGLGWAHAQRVVEAILIAAGTAGLLQVTGPPGTPGRASAANCVGGCVGCCVWW